VAWTLLLPWWYGHTRLGGASSIPLARVALVQGNVSAAEKWDPVFKDSTLALYDGLTRRAARAAPRPDVIVWPETAAPTYVNAEPMDRDRIEKVARDVNTPVLVGFPEAVADERGTSRAPYAFYNAAALFTPDAGLTTTYRKTHLVPFGEAIPWSTRLRFLRAIDLGQGNFWPGREHTVFDPPGPRRARFGVLVCFESIFPELARAEARAGADYLVVITNDEWFGRTAAPAQHAWMAALRAVETGRSVARCANTGLTWIIDPYGRVTDEAQTRVPAILHGVVARTPGDPPYVRWGEACVIACAAWVALATATAWRRRRTT
jgi:apolipoprotein N-acyltransferase